MEAVILPSPAEVGRHAASVVADAVRQLARPVIGVATGSSPLALYDELAAAVAARELDLSRAKAFALDEYVGLPPGHPQGYAEVVRRTVTGPLGLRPEDVAVPDGGAADLAAACRAYEDRIAEAGGVDVQILGIGANGHIGFNEPMSPLDSRTRLARLSERTRADNARFFPAPEDVPTHCVTQGLGTIMEARRIVLLAQGRAKADAVAAMLEGPVTAACPASVLQLHPDAIVVVDVAAASALGSSRFRRSRTPLT